MRRLASHRLDGRMAHGEASYGEGMVVDELRTTELALQQGEGGNNLAPEDFGAGGVFGVDGIACHVWDGLVDDSTGQIALKPDVSTSIAMVKCLEVRKPVLPFQATHTTVQG